MLIWHTSFTQTAHQFFSVLARSLEPTKRNIVSLVGKFYDPLGILAPVVVKFKMFLQTMCEAKLEWDQPLPTDLLSKWQKLSAGLLEAQTISIPRCCTEQVEEEVISYTLCGFCDASFGAYAAVVYLLMETEKKHSVLRCQDESISPQKTDHSTTGTFVCITPISADDKYFSEFRERITIVASKLLHRLQGCTLLDTRYR